MSGDHNSSDPVPLGDRALAGALTLLFERAADALMASSGAGDDWGGTWAESEGSGAEQATEMWARGRGLFAEVVASAGEKAI